MKNYTAISLGLLLCFSGVNAVANQTDDEPTLETLQSASPEKPRRKMTLAQQAEQGRIDSKKLEESQLEKARAAANSTYEREQEILKRQRHGDWQAEQRKKAQAQFDERAAREQKYLQQAQDAAAKERKIETKAAVEEQD